MFSNLSISVSIGLIQKFSMVILNYVSIKLTDKKSKRSNFMSLSNRNDQNFKHIIE